MKKLNYNQKGLSLIEILVGVAIMITVTTIVLSMIVSTFRISNKTTVNSQVRQNGNYAMNQATRLLQFADSFEGANRNGVFNPTPSFFNISTCTTGTPAQPIDHIWFKYQDEDRYISCNMNDGIQIGDNLSMASSINSDLEVVSCSMTCLQEGGAPEGPVITIELELSTSDPDSVVERQASQNFSTTVKMRNP